MQLDDIKQKALVRILDDDEALGEALKLYLELDGWKVAVYTQAKRFFAEDRPFKASPKAPRCRAAWCSTCACPNCRAWIVSACSTSASPICP